MFLELDEFLPEVFRADGHLGQAIRQGDLLPRGIFFMVLLLCPALLILLLIRSIDIFINFLLFPVFIFLTVFIVID